MFSYKAQVDDAMEEDTVSLPHQQSFSSLKTDSDYIYQVHVPSFHMPFHESPITKSSSIVKQTSSLYSLSSRRDPNTSRYSSQIRLYGTSPSGKRSTKRLIAQQSTPDLGKYTLTSSGNLGAPQKVPPHLEAPSWKTRSVSLIGQCDGGLTSILPSTSQSHFTYRQKPNESVTQFLSESSKSSLDSESLRVKPKRSKSIVEDKCETISVKKTIEQSSSPLESSLQSLLSGESHEMRQAIDSATKDTKSVSLLTSSTTGN